MKIFISYSYEDKKFVAELTTKLKLNGIEVLPDLPIISVNENIAEQSCRVHSMHIFGVYDEPCIITKWYFSFRRIFFYSQLFR